MSARRVARGGGALVAFSFAALSLGACDLIIKAAYGDRHVDPTITCTSSGCVCLPGLGDCDDDVDNGCEAELTTNENCGACGNSCDNGTCEGGSCACHAGFDDCDGDLSNGCETELASDDGNCGACHNDCGGGTCLAGVCGPASLGTFTGATSLGLTPSFAYVGSCDDPPISGIFLDTRSKFSAVSASGCVHAIAVSGTTLFFAADDAVRFFATGDAFAAAPGTLAMDVHPTRFLAVGAAHVYWWDVPSVVGAHALLRIQLHSDTPEKVADGDLNSLAADDVSVYWSDGSGIHSLTHADITATPFDFSKTAQATAIAVDAQNLYAADENGIESYSLVNGTPTLLAPGVQVRGIAVSATHVYWAEVSDSSLKRVPIGGGNVKTLVKGQTFAFGAPVLVDDTSVYWIAGNEVRRMAQ